MYSSHVRCSHFFFKSYHRFHRCSRNPRAFKNTTQFSKDLAATSGTFSYENCARVQRDVRRIFLNYFPTNPSPDFINSFYIYSFLEISTLSKITKPPPTLECTSPSGHDADEGFASSSSVEQDPIFEVIRRKKSILQPQQTIEDFKSDPIKASRKMLEEKMFMAPLESILWTASFFWIFYQLYIDGESSFDNQVMAGRCIRCLAVNCSKLTLC